ncbi:hypothetical protein ACVWXN_000198 [Bradyrhizobium sp. i1.4.4]
MVAGSPPFKVALLPSDSQVRWLMRLRYLRLAVDTVFAIEKRADSARISTAHEAVDFGEAAAFQQSDHGAQMSVLSMS